VADSEEGRGRTRQRRAGTSAPNRSDPTGGAAG
jgi:hypothetical protein